MKAGDFVTSGFGHLPMDTHEKDAVGMQVQVKFEQDEDVPLPLPMPTPHV